MLPDRIRPAALALMALMGFGLAQPGAARAQGAATNAPVAPLPAEFAAMPACKALQAKYPALVGRKLVIGLGGYNPGFQAPSAADPAKLEGLDPDTYDRLGACLGFTYEFQLGAFNVLITSVLAGRYDMGPSMYVTPARAEQVAFLSSYQVVNGSVVPKGNPKRLTSLDSLCGATIAAAAGTYEAVNLAPEQSAKCEAAGKPKVEVLLVQNTDNAILAVQSGRADIHLTALPVARNLARVDPRLEQAFNVDLPIRNGYPIAKGNTMLRNAVFEAFQILQSSGAHQRLLEKWGQGGEAMRPVENLG